MYKLVTRLFVFSVLLLTVTGCQRNDDEPLIPTRPISRLYVSLFDFQADETQDPYHNLGVIDPADGERMQGVLYNSQVNGGGSVYFSPQAGRIFQASTNNQAIVLLSVSDIGVPTRSGMLMNEDLTGIRGLQYDHASRNLFVSNTQTPSGIYIFDNPMNRNGETDPHRFYALDGIRPWGIIYQRDSLLVARTGEDGGVNVYTDVQQSIKDSTALVLSSSVRITGANSIRGIAYSSKLDLLVLTDFEEGRILFFENAQALFSQSQVTATPDRVLQGASTGLINPIDIAIDDRDNAHLLYVADRMRKAVLRFDLQASGNTAPQTVTEFPIRPESVFLDARGVVSTNSN